MGIDTTFVSGQGETATPMIRYAEALLAYAEAAEELGKCDAAVLEKTIKPLRERAGVTYLAPSAIDPNFPDFGYTISANLQEIRRERRSELPLQGMRLDDLMHISYSRGNVAEALTLEPAAFYINQLIRRMKNWLKFW